MHSVTKSQISFKIKPAICLEKVSIHSEASHSLAGDTLWYLAEVNISIQHLKKTNIIDITVN